MTYASAIELAVLARPANTQGLTWSPDGTKVGWSANSSSLDKWEAWNVSTQTIISSGVLDASIAAPSGSDPGIGFVLTDDHYLYTTAGTSSNRRLTRYANYGGGIQEDMGSVGVFNTPSVSAGVRNMVTGDGHHRILCPAWSTQPDAYLFDHAVPGTPPVHLDTLAGTGFEFQVKDACVDASGDGWVIGGYRDIATNKIAFWRVVNVSGLPRTEFFTATLPAVVTGGIFIAYVFFAAGHFVVQTQQGAMITVEYDGTVSHTVVGPIGDGSYNIATQMHVPRPADTGFWVENVQYSCTDLTVLQTLAYSLWGASIDGHVTNQGVFYDRGVNGFFVAGLDSPDVVKSFAWLFFPAVFRPQIRMF